MSEELSLADVILGEALIFFSSSEKAERAALALEEVDERIDALALAVQALDLARSQPGNWAEYSPAWTGLYENLWPAQKLLLFLLGNYAALHASIRKKMQVPLMSPESIAWEVTAMKWVQHEATVEGLLQRFLQHPASQVPRSD